MLLIILVKTIMTQRLESELQKRGVYIAKNIASESIDSIVTENFLNLNLLILEHKEIDEDIEYIFILDEKGKVVAHTFEKKFPAALKEANIVKSGQAYNIQPLIMGETHILDIAYPILKGELGVLHLGISEEPIMGAISAITQTLMLIIIGFLVLEGVITVITATAVTKPLTKLIHSAKEIGSGNLEHKVSVKTNDEIGQLSGAFNKMTEDLRATTVKRDELTREVNERRKAEEALKISEKKYRDLVDNALVGIFKGNLNGDIHYVNDALLKIFEFESAEEMIGTGVLPGYKNPGDSEILIGNLKRTGKVNNLEFEALTKKGETKNILLSATLDEDVISGMVMDITEHKQTEKALQRAEHLKMLGELVIGLAQEIRNPLAGIQLSVETLSKEVFTSEEDREIILKIINEIKRIDLLLKNLLDFARPSKPQLTPINMNDILDKTIAFSLRHPSFSSNTVTAINVLKNFDKNLPEVIADPIQLQQAFMNMILNAIDAMQDGGTLTVKTSYDAELNVIQIAISDTGKGIDEKVRDRIFQPFFTTKARHRGMGLAITKRLIEEHGGDICVESSPGKGTTFIALFPIKQVRKEQITCLV
ncbi:MAG: ATP-binding protein [Thermodesulfovibrionia bacterium]|nr:ATP-binding protein [Thermodesulfovibrionia bacterium]